MSVNVYSVDVPHPMNCVPTLGVRDRAFPVAVGQFRGAAGKAPVAGLFGEVCDGCGGDGAAFGGDHFVVDLDEQGADEPDHGDFVGEEPDDVGASLQFAVQAFNRVVRPDLGPVRGREPGLGEQVRFHGFEALGDTWRVGAQLFDNSAQLGGGGGGVGLHEDRADQLGDHLAVAWFAAESRLRIA